VSPADKALYKVSTAAAEVEPTESHSDIPELSLTQVMDLTTD
jgi:hypothetical protein